jgi:hypothetical protein
MTSIHLSFYRALYDQEQLRAGSNKLVTLLRENGRPIPMFEDWLAERCQRAERRLDRFEEAARVLAAIMEEGT